MVVGWTDNVPPQNTQQQQGYVGGGCGVASSDIGNTDKIGYLPMKMEF